jgi:4-amino-4-deoxy-L-arabinose transferase-like glycosyltransferase
MILKHDRLIFVSLLLVHFVLLVSIIKDFSLSYNEVKIIFENNTFIGLLTNISLFIFGQNDYAARLPFILFYLGSAIVFYFLLEDYFKYNIDRLITIGIFMILPGVNTAALLVNESIVVVFFILLYLYLYKIRNQECYILLILFLLIDNSFAILYLALFFWSLKKKDTFLLIFSLLLFALSMSIYGFEIGGRPRGYFVDTFAIFASIFSPLLFIYFFYSIYRVGLKFEKDLYWYISVTALSLALVFSLRQKVNVGDFAPFVVIAIPIMVKLFMHSYRVRLKAYRKKHFIFSGLTVFILILNFMVLIFSKEMYPFFDNPTKNFTYNHHVVKELAKELKEKDINAVFIDDRKYQLRLAFYGIAEDDKTRLIIKNIKDENSDIAISYFSKVVARFDIQKLKN